MENIIFDFTEQDEPINGWIRFGENYELEVYLDGIWLNLEEYERKQDDNTRISGENQKKPRRRKK